MGSNSAVSISLSCVANKPFSRRTSTAQGPLRGANGQPTTRGMTTITAGGGGLARKRVRKHRRDLHYTSSHGEKKGHACSQECGVI